MTLTSKLTTAIATGAVLLNALAPLALADTSLDVSGNGSRSDNNINVSSNNNTTVSQNNNANVTNNVSTDIDTGHNRANDNTGGDVFVSSGNAASNVDISNSLNSNRAVVSGGNNNGDTSVLVGGNGSRSDNTVNLNNGGSTRLTQDNTANVTNNVSTRENTGFNSANENTGGNTTVWSGDARSGVFLDTRANANVAQVNGGNGGNETDVLLKGNGAYSDNAVNLNNGGSTRVRQNNSAYVTNNVDSNLTTGYNRANDNTGGDTTVQSGNARSLVGIDNMLNFNAANIDNGGWSNGDVFAKIAGNGAYSDNAINANFGGHQAVYQNNNADVTNNVHQGLKTGFNTASENTGPYCWWSCGYDPVTVWSGDAGSGVHVNNAANQNELGLGSYDMPWLGQIDFNFDMNHLWN